MKVPVPPLPIELSEAERTMKKITLIMFARGEISQHVFPVFFRQGFLMASYPTWDNIHNWVAQGYTVEIRPPSDEENAKMAAIIDERIRVATTPI